MKSSQVESEKQMSPSRFSSNFMKQNSMDMLQTQGSCSYSDDDQQSLYGTEEECLMKLMEQRKKIEELTYLHQKAVDQLKKQEDKVKKFEQQQTTFEQLKTIKVKYLSLGKEFQEMMGEKALLETQNEKLTDNLNKLTKQHQKLIKLSQLKEMRKDEQTNLSINRYEQLLKDKDDEIRRNIDVYEIKQKEYEEQLHEMNQVMDEMKGQIVDMKRNHQKEITQLTNEIVKRDTGLDKMMKILENIKEENSQLRKQIKELDNQFMAKEKEWIQAQDELIFEINSQKRKVADLQNSMNNVQYEKQKLQQKLATEKNLTINLKQQLKQLQENSSIALDQLTHSYEQKILQQKHQIEELKQSVQQLLEVKEIYNKQNDMLKDQIQKDQEQKKKRNLIMRSQLREIQKIENSVKKVY